MPLIIPYENCRIKVEIQDFLEVIINDNIWVRVASGNFSSEKIPRSVTVQETANELSFVGPGRIHFIAELTFKTEKQIPKDKPALITVTILPIDVERPISFNAILFPVQTIPNSGALAKWEHLNQF